ncbi:pre-mRNA 3'-end-processing factor FIP1, partial [Austrofundulus limnaeus]|uniref:Pre-mRNA 3'-end-processing factor FIP1 n=1 Tax=Austrofundulus limnaeus TaxID=52670 RepID=A0A2I4BZN5_AUSLI
DERKKSENEQIPHSSGLTPTPSESISEERIDVAGGSAQRTVENIQEVQEANQTVQLLEEKPWRKPGIEISDYFNYGFDENSWRAYCSKQYHLQTLNRCQGTQVLAKKKHQQHGKQVSSCASSSSARRSCRKRESEDGIDVSRRQAGHSSRDKRRLSFTDAVNNSQITERSKKGNNVTQCDLPAPVSLNSLFAFVSPPCTAPLFRTGCCPPSPPAPLCSGVPASFDGPSTSSYQSSSGSVIPDGCIIPGIMGASPAMTITTKAWERYLSQQMHGRDRDKTRSHNQQKKSKRSRYKERQIFSFSHNRRKEQTKHRVSTDKHRGRSPERAREKMPRDKIKKWRQPRHSSCSRNSEDKDFLSPKRDKKGMKKRRENRMNSADKKRK